MLVLLALLNRSSMYVQDLKRGTRGVAVKRRLKHPVLVLALLARGRSKAGVQLLVAVLAQQMRYARRDPDADNGKLEFLRFARHMEAFDPTWWPALCQTVTVGSRVKTQFRTRSNDEHSNEKLGSRSVAFHMYNTYARSATTRSALRAEGTRVSSAWPTVSHAAFPRGYHALQ